MCELTPKISWTTTRPPRGVPLGTARYAEKVWPSSAVRVMVSAMASSFFGLPSGRLRARRSGRSAVLGASAESTGRRVTVPKTITVCEPRGAAPAPPPPSARRGGAGPALGPLDERHDFLDQLA